MVTACPTEGTIHGASEPNPAQTYVPSAPASVRPVAPASVATGGSVVSGTADGSVTTDGVGVGVVTGSGVGGRLAVEVAAGDGTGAVGGLAVDDGRPPVVHPATATAG